MKKEKLEQIIEQLLEKIAKLEQTNKDLQNTVKDCMEKVNSLQAALEAEKIKKQFIPSEPIIPPIGEKEIPDPLKPPPAYPDPFRDIPNPYNPWYPYRPLIYGEDQPRPFSYNEDTFKYVPNEDMFKYTPKDYWFGPHNASYGTLTCVLANY